ncbi:hypothetical protein FHW88_003354 [Mucilaginibacter sp. SG538B]|uniref:hypothetical protein n=1 Tax=Mucilaginibacter sp. SG538B TaxID=2587021 RepID=UPI00159D4597|nr:hypothetical protein [Mucilaginibacter sp. SG538B]NVM65050.1 hypothetical protein [Mucilaginibacter sp. SG538B]
MRLRKSKPKYARQNRLKIRFEQQLVRIQCQISDNLNRRTQHWNRASKILMLAAICLLFGGASLLLLLRAWY